MHVLRTRLIQTPAGRSTATAASACTTRMSRGWPRASCIDVHSKVMVIDDSVASHRLVEPVQPLDGARHRVRPGGRVARRGARRRRHRRVPRRGCSPSTSIRRPSACARKSRTRAACNGAIAAFSAQPRTLRQLEELPEWSETVLTVAAVADPEEPIALEMLLSERHADEVFAPDKPAWGKLAGIVAALARADGVWQFTPLRQVATAEAAIAWAKAFGAQPWAPFALMAAYTPACLVMFPRPLITLAAVIAFGPWLGFFYSLTGICASSAVTWWMGRHMRRDTRAPPRRSEARPDGRGAEKARPARHDAAAPRAARAVRGGEHRRRRDPHEALARGGRHRDRAAARHAHHHRVRRCDRDRGHAARAT